MIAPGCLPVKNNNQLFKYYLNFNAQIPDRYNEKTLWQA